MKSAVVVDCVRTPIGRAHKEKGWFRDVRSDDLAVACIKALVERTGIDPALIEDVVLGNTTSSMRAGSMPVLSTSALMQATARSSLRTSRNQPFSLCARPIGVRTQST